jgi:hypothetical protein
MGSVAGPKQQCSPQGMGLLASPHGTLALLSAALFFEWPP